ncbi:monovalent cation/H(+) antiporter subunit G [Aquisalimonas lutea]|uniref:monovalent cation/H(+) antiporter subunit G n=1 Tax=Aquisalimonas lutea TaxID=1327750 RepID=UPI0025B48466|nr:monovalent cation/H(+) antiporter subunit G [Aquisalimonas lutea]MDN3519188.1 monovalent cation/H(+) antiporter subunit G [Aquisalimonas lutea]
MNESIAAVILLIGGAFVVIGALGAVRMPDLMLRMHATTKAGILGGGLVAIAGGVFFNESEVMVRALAILAFVVLTGPVAAHMIARAGYFTGAPFWERTLKDDLRSNLDKAGGYLYSAQEQREGKGRPQQQAPRDDGE